MRIHITTAGVLAIGLMLCLSPIANAAVILEVGPTVQDRFTTSTASLDFTTNSASNSVLVVLTATKSVGTSGGTDSVTSLMFDSQVFLQQATGADTIRQFQIWTLDLGDEAGVAGSIDITLAGAGEAAFFAYQLSNATLEGLKTNWGLDSSAPPNVFDASLTGDDAPAAGSVIIDLGLSNNNKVGLTPSGETRTGSLAVESITDDPGAMTSYITNWSGGDAVLGYDANNRGGAISIAIAEVPEPATISLVGLGGLALLRRHRK